MRDSGPRDTKSGFAASRILDPRIPDPGIPDHGPKNPEPRDPGARDTESQDRETPRIRDAVAVINEYSVVVFKESWVVAVDKFCSRIFNKLSSSRLISSCLSRLISLVLAFNETSLQRIMRFFLWRPIRIYSCF